MSSDFSGEDESMGYESEFEYADDSDGFEYDEPAALSPAQGSRAKVISLEIKSALQTSSQEKFALPTGSRSPWHSCMCTSDYLGRLESFQTTLFHFTDLVCSIFQLQAKYKILSPYLLKERQSESVNQIADLLNVPFNEATRVLRHYKWYAFFC